MTHVELVEQISKKARIPKTKVRRILAAFSSEIERAVLSGEKVTVLRFGAFVPLELRPRPVFGGTRAVRQKRSIRFKPARRRAWRS